MSRLIRAVILVSLVLGLTLWSPVHHARAASSWSVCSAGCNFTKISTAIADSHVLDGDTINVHAGTYSEHNITVDKSVSILGAGSGLVIVDAGQLGRVFQVVDSMTVTISGMTIKNGKVTAQSGQGVYGAGVQNSGGNLTMNDVIIMNNIALTTPPGSYSFGGGISDSGTLIMTNSRIMNNTSDTNGGGLEVYFGSTAQLTNVLVQGNSVTASNGGAGGIQINSDFDTSQSTVTLDRVTVNNNTSAGNSAGIYVQNYANVSITRSTISNNSSNGDYGGILVDSHSTLTMDRTTINGNQAGTAHSVGGLGVSPTASASLTNVTIANNVAGSDGGIASNGTLTITNSTISGNTGGGIGNYGSLNMTNTIIAGSLLGGDCYNTATLGTNVSNLIQDNSCSPALSGDPMLGTLANNSGPTKTMALLSGSPAIDAGDDSSCPSTDQRSVPRPQDGDRNGTSTCDIGAFEYRPQKVSLSSAALNFGNQLVGTSSAVKSVTLSNVGDHTLAFTSITTALPYSLLATGTCPLATGTLAAHASCTVKVKFSPTAVGLFAKSVTVKSNATNSPNTIALSGSGVAGTQLLKNPSFENDANLDKKPDNWSFTNFNAATDKRDCAYHQSGSCSLKLVGNGTNKAAFQTIWKTNGAAGNDFTFALWSKALNIPSGAVYRLQVQFYNGTTLVGSKILNFLPGTHAFQKVNGSFTPSTAYTKIVFTIMFKAASGSAWFDTASLNWAP